MKKTKTAGKLTVVLWTILSILLSMPVSQAQAQAGGKRKITGSVRARLTEEPLVAATIAIKGSDVKVSSDLQGLFVIEAKTGDVLVVSSAGFTTKEFKVGTLNNIDVRVDKD